MGVILLFYDVIRNRDSLLTLLLWVSQIFMRVVENEKKQRIKGKTVAQWINFQNNKQVGKILVI